MTRNDFIKEIAALAAPLSLSIPLSVTIAQAILESAWGESGLTKTGKALFGIKADSAWTGKKYSTLTREVYDGQTVTITAAFRAYDSWAASIIDHDNFLRKNKRYAPVLAAPSAYACCDELQKCGYATDPNYSHKLQQIISQYGLLQYDKNAGYSEIVEILAFSGDTKELIIDTAHGDKVKIIVRVASEMG